LNRLFANATSTLVAEQPWLGTDVPLEVRRSAVEELWIARSVNLKVIQKKNRERARGTPAATFTMNYRRVSDTQAVSLKLHIWGTTRKTASTGRS